MLTTPEFQGDSLEAILISSTILAMAIGGMGVGFGREARCQRVQGHRRWPDHREGQSGPRRHGWLQRPRARRRRPPPPGDDDDAARGQFQYVPRGESRRVRPTAQVPRSGDLPRGAGEAQADDRHGRGRSAPVAEALESGARFGGHLRDNPAKFSLRSWTSRTTVRAAAPMGRPDPRALHEEPCADNPHRGRADMEADGC